MINRAGLRIPGISLVRRGTIVGLLALWIAVAAGCAPVEVRVVDGASEAPAVEEQEAHEEGGATVDPVTEGVLATTVAYLVVFAEICGAFIIAIAVVQALLQFFRFLSRPEQNEHIKDDIRLRLGRSLAIALEFALAADILKTAVAPTWGVIAQLAAIAALRTALNYFLEREIRDVEERRAGQHLDDRPGNA